MAVRVRVMCWNINEPVARGHVSEVVILQKIADQINQQSPDLVLLNEVRNRRWPFGHDQTKWLSEKTAMPYRLFGATTATGITGHKGVAILSRYPLAAAHMHFVTRDGRNTTFGTLSTTVKILDRIHHVFSTRFAPNNFADYPIESKLAHEQAVALVKQVPSQDRIIFGGDFNSLQDSEQMQMFMSASGLREVEVELPDPGYCPKWPPEGRVDYIFYRSPYRVRHHERRCASSDPDSLDSASDHPWIVAELEVERDAAFAPSQSVPTTMVAGRKYKVSLRMRNTGSTTWTPAGVSYYALGSQSPQDNKIWGLNRIKVPTSVPPGGEITFAFEVTAPSTPGTYDFQWRMVHEWVEWFGDYTPKVKVSVTPPQLSVGIEPYPVVLGQSRQYIVRAEDAGTHAPVVGTVSITNPGVAAKHFPVNTPFSFSFRTGLTSSGEELVIPHATVSAPGYATAELDLGVEN